MKDYSQPATEDELSTAKESLQNNGMHVVVAANGDGAREMVLAMIPKGAEVFTMPSVTLDSIGLAKAVNESGEYDAVREKLVVLDSDAQRKERRRLGTAPDWALGSVQAVTEEGHLLIASATGSQLAAEVYGAEKVIFVVGHQKIVTDDADGKERIDSYVLPLEDKRALKVYGINSVVGKLLIVKREVTPERITVVLVNEKLGF